MWVACGEGGRLASWSIASIAAFAWSINCTSFARPAKPILNCNREEIAGQREFRIRAFDPIRVEAMNGNDRGVGLAAFETRKKPAAPRRRVPSLVRNLRGYGPPTLRDSVEVRVLLVDALRDACRRRPIAKQPVRAYKEATVEPTDAGLLSVATFSGGACAHYRPGLRRRPRTSAGRPPCPLLARQPIIGIREAVRPTEQGCGDSPPKTYSKRR